VSLGITFLFLSLQKNCAIRNPVYTAKFAGNDGVSEYDFSTRATREARTVLATVEIIMRVVTRAHRLIQLNDSFAGPKHHLRVCPVPSVFPRLCVFASPCVRARRGENVSRKRTFQPTPRRAVASRNNTMLLMLRLQFRHNFLSRPRRAEGGYRMPGLL